MGEVARRIRLAKIDYDEETEAAARVKSRREANLLKAMLKEQYDCPLAESEVCYIRDVPVVKLDGDYWLARRSDGVPMVWTVCNHCRRIRPAKAVFGGVLMDIYKTVVAIDNPWYCHECLLALRARCSAGR